MNRVPAIFLLLVTLSLGVVTVPTLGAGTYSFSGKEGFNTNATPLVSGTLTLDLADPGVVIALTGGLQGDIANYTSPNHLLAGSFDLWTFTGVPTVAVKDALPGPESEFSQDHWIVRTSVTGGTVNGWTPMFFGLYYYTSAAGITGTQLTPPTDPLFNVNEFDFSFFLQLSDGDTGVLDISGPLFTVQSVPEPTAFTLVLLGGLPLILKLRRARVVRA